MAGESLRFAVLIDGDNVSAEAMDRLFATTAEFGDPVVRMVYGGVQTTSKKWEQAASRHALSLGRRHLHAKGHNATDIEMVIGAMDLLAGDRIDGFWLVSSDADFTPLAIRLREAGKIVYGCGRTAPEGFRSACHQFFLMELSATPASTANVVSFPRSGIEHAVAGMRRAIDKHKMPEGWALLSLVGTALGSEIPGFKVKHYGAKSLTKLAEKAGCFELKQTERGETVVRLRQSR